MPNYYDKIYTRANFTRDEINYGTKCRCDKNLNDERSTWQYGFDEVSG